MAIQVEEKWSGKYMDETTARRVFTVIGTTNSYEAKISPPVPLIHPESGKYIATGGRAATPIGLGVWEVTVGYVNSGSPFGIGGGVRPDSYRITPFTREEPVDMDFDNNPIVTSSGSPVKKTTDIVGYTIVVERTEPNFSLAVMMDYGNSINIGPFTIGDVDVPKGACKCLSIYPVDEWTSETAKFRMSYNFEVITDIQGQIVEDPWNLRFIDEDYYQYILDEDEFPIRVPIIDPDIRAMTRQPVRLDGQGAIFDLKDKRRGQGVGTPKGATVEFADKAAFLKYRVKKQRDFTGLNL